MPFAGSPLTSQADLTINLECAISSRRRRGPERSAFRAPPGAAQALGAGVDVANLANNHTLDYGPPAFPETLSTLDHGVGHTGGGIDEQLPKPR